MLGERPRTDSVLQLSEGINPTNILILDFWTPEIQDNELLLLEATRFTELCYGSPRKVIQICLKGRDKTCTQLIQSCSVTEEFTVSFPFAGSSSACSDNTMRPRANPNVNLLQNLLGYMRKLNSLFSPGPALSLVESIIELHLQLLFIACLVLL